MNTAIHLEGGFADPVFDSQSVFRGIMEAMARPGTVAAVDTLPRPPAPLSPMAAALALTLCDADTPVWLDPPLAAEEAVRAWLGFQTGAPCTAVAAEAHFALVADPGAMVSLDNFAQGTQDYPDRSTTIVLSLKSLRDGARLVLSGPGIKDAAHLAPAPVPRHFAEQWRAMQARFPRGVDLILAAPEGVAALPRTTRIAPEEG